MFGVEQGQIGRVIGALERTERVCVTHNVKLTPAHEQVLRKAPKPLQDKIAEVVLTRDEPIFNICCGNFHDMMFADLY